MKDNKSATSAGTAGQPQAFPRRKCMNTSKQKWQLLFLFPFDLKVPMTFTQLVWQRLWQKAQRSSTKLFDSRRQANSACW